MSQMSTRDKNEAPAAVRRALRAAVKAETESALAARIGISRNTLSRLIAGQSVRRSTLKVAAGAVGVGLVGGIAKERT